MTANARRTTNGSGAAAALAAGIGACVLAVLAIVADDVPAVKSLMIFSKPTGPLSGVTTCAVVAWVLVWWMLERRWRAHTIAPRVFAAALLLLLAGVLLTFPPVATLF